MLCLPAGAKVSVDQAIDPLVDHMRSCMGTRWSGAVEVSGLATRHVYEEGAMSLARFASGSPQTSPATCRQHKGKIPTCIMSASRDPSIVLIWVIGWTGEP